MDAIATALKAPIMYSAEQALGKCLPKERILDSELVTKIYAYAIAIIFVIGMLLTAPLWFVGDMIELAQGKEVGLPPIKLSERVSTLDPEKTKYWGWSLSSFQYSQDPKFCKDSNWGKYYEKHPDCEFGLHGTDFLTEDGLATI